MNRSQGRYQYEYNSKDNRKPKMTVGISRQRHLIPNLPRSYELREKLATGFYGEMYRSGEYAIKISSLKTNSNQAQQLLDNQINSIMSTSNKCIIKFYEHFFEGGKHYFVFELLETNLKNYLQNFPQKRLEQKQACKIFEQIVEGQLYLRQANILHGDINPQNIFLSDQKDVKIANFQFSNKVQNFDADILNPRISTLRTQTMVYLAPQILQGKQYNSQSQIWSMGVVLYEMIFGELPWKENSIQKLLKLIKNVKINFPKDVQVSKDTKNLITDMLSVNIQNRIKWEEIEERISYFSIIRNIKTKFKSLTKLVRKFSNDKDSSNVYNTKNSIQTTKRLSIYHDTGRVFNDKNLSIPKPNKQNKKINPTPNQINYINPGQNSQEKDSKRWMKQQNRQSNNVPNFSQQKNPAKGKSNQFIPSCPEQGQFLGKGAFGQVYKFGDQAVKVIDTSKKKHMKDIVKSEIQVMRKVSKCQNVAKFYNDKQIGDKIYLYMEYCQSNLKDYIRSFPNKSIPQSKALDIFKQILIGYKSLLNIGVVHKDIKPDNILLKDIDKYKSTKAIKIIDFGLSIMLKDAYNDKMHQNSGTPDYMPPQVLIARKDIPSYTSKCQIWALGVILYEMICGKRPFQLKGPSELYNYYKIIIQSRVEFPKQVSISESSKDLITKMLQKQQRNRISWNQLFYKFNIQSKNNICCANPPKEKQMNNCILKNSNENNIQQRLKLPPRLPNRMHNAIPVNKPYQKQNQNPNYYANQPIYNHSQTNSRRQRSNSINK